MISSGPVAEREKGRHGDLTEAAGSPPLDVDQTSLFVFLNPVVRNLRWLVLAVIVSASVTAALVANREMSYAQRISFVTTSGGGSSPAGLTGLATQFGITIPSSSGGSDPPEFYAMLLRSQDLRANILTREYDVHLAGEDPGRMSLLDYWDIDGESSGERLRLAAGQLDALTTIGVEPATGLIRVEVRNSDPTLARQIAAAYLDEVTRFNTERRQFQARMERQFAAESLTRAESELRTAEAAWVNFQQENRGYTGVPRLLVVSQQLQREILIREQVVISLARALEEARLAEVREAPVITIIESTDGPPVPLGRGRIRSVVFASTLAGVLALLIFYAGEVLRWSRSHYRLDPHYREFRTHLRRFVPFGRRAGSTTD